MYKEDFRVKTNFRLSRNGHAILEKLSEKYQNNIDYNLSKTNLIEVAIKVLEKMKTKEIIEVYDSCEERMSKVRRKHQKNS